MPEQLKLPASVLAKVQTMESMKSNYIQGVLDTMGITFPVNIDMASGVIAPTIPIEVKPEKVG